MESELEMAKRHMREAQLLINRQCSVIETLRAKGYPTEMAIKLLGEMEAALDVHRTHVEIILEEQRKASI